VFRCEEKLTQKPYALKVLKKTVSDAEVRGQGSRFPPVNIKGLRLTLR